MQDKQFQVKRTGAFVVVPKGAVIAIKDIGTDAFALLSILCMYANDSCALVRLQDLCDTSGLALNSVRKALKILQRANMLHVQATFNDKGRQIANSYIINDDPQTWRLPLPNHDTLPNRGTLPNCGTLPQFGRASTIRDLTALCSNNSDLESINNDLREEFCEAKFFSTPSVPGGDAQIAENSTSACARVDGDAVFARAGDTPSENGLHEKSDAMLFAGSMRTSRVSEQTDVSETQADAQKAMHSALLAQPAQQESAPQESESAQQDFFAAKTANSQKGPKTGRRRVKAAEGYDHTGPGVQQASKRQKKAKERKSPRDMQKAKEVQEMMLAFLYGAQEAYSKAQWSAVVKLYESVRLPDCEIEPEAWRAYEAFWRADEWLRHQSPSFSLVLGKEKGFSAWYSRCWRGVCPSADAPQQVSEASGWISKRVFRVGPDGVGRVEVVWERRS